MTDRHKKKYLGRSEGASERRNKNIIVPGTLKIRLFYYDDFIKCANLGF